MENQFKVGATTFNLQALADYYGKKKFKEEYSKHNVSWDIDNTWIELQKAIKERGIISKLAPAKGNGKDYNASKSSDK